jgi:hypothetical protein
VCNKSLTSKEIKRMATEQGSSVRNSPLSANQLRIKQIAYLSNFSSRYFSPGTLLKRVQDKEVYRKEADPYCIDGST